MLSAEWPKTSCIGKRRKREKRKKKKRKEKKRKRKEKRRKRKRGEWGSKQIKKQKTRGVSSDSVYCKSLDFPWNFPVLLGQ